jgi:hypothetical protein
MAQQPPELLNCACLYESRKRSISFSPTWTAFRIYCTTDGSYLVAKAYFTGNKNDTPWKLELVRQYARQESYQNARAVLDSYAYGRRLPAVIVG